MTDKKNLGKWLNQIGNFADTAKQAIKQGNNDVALNVMKTGFNELEYITDFFYVNMYLNKTSILYQNFEIFKYIIDNNKINVKDNPTVNSSLVKSDYKRKSSEVIKELKDHYIDLEMPYVMIAAVGGSVKILESLLSKGADVNSSGYVSLSRKKKNAFISNALGAAAYFGNLDMVKYLIETKPSIDLNFKTIEKSSKVKSSVFSRDFSHTTPLTLAISGENDESDCINIVRLLIKQSKIEKDCYDHERNSPLHLAVKYNKMEVVKFFVNEVKYSLEERNVDGYSPFSFAQQNNNSEMVNFLKQFEKTTPNIDELLESIQTDKKTKTKGKKTKKHKEIGILLGSSDYQDSVKTKTVVQTLSLKPIPMSEDKEINVQKIAPIDIISKTDPSTIEHKIINIDKEEYEAYKLKEKHSKERKQLLLLQEQQKKISESEKVKQPKAEKKEIKEPVITNEVVKPKIVLEEVKIEKQEQSNKIEISNTLQAEKPRTIIVGMKTKIKEHKKSQDIKEKLPPNKIESSVQETNILNENQNKSPIIDKDVNIKEENWSSTIIPEEKINEIIIKNEEKREDTIENNQKIGEISLKINQESINQIKELSRKNREYELKYEEERKRRLEYEKIISSRLFDNFPGTKRIDSNEENIKDLLELANEELLKKSSIINKLQNQIDYYELKNLSKITNEDYQYLNNFFAKQIHNLAQKYEKKGNY